MKRPNPHRGRQTVTNEEQELFQKTQALGAEVMDRLSKLPRHSTEVKRLLNQLVKWEVDAA